jgi:predicted transcriptional regulator
MPFRCARGALSKNEEPRLEELLTDDVLQLVMARDGVTPETLRKLARSSGRKRYKWRGGR